MIKWINKKRNKKGFTLIELIVVIAILGILAAIAIPRLGAFQKTAVDRQLEADTRIIESAGQMYYAQYNSFPADETVLGAYLDQKIINKYTVTFDTTTGKITSITPQ